MGSLKWVNYAKLRRCGKPDNPGLSQIIGPFFHSQTTTMSTTAHKTVTKRLLCLTPVFRLQKLSTNLVRGVSSMTAMHRVQKEEGDISSIFTTLDESLHTRLPDRFIDLKKSLWKDSFTATWKEVLSTLETTTEEIAIQGSKVIVNPEIFCFTRASYIFSKIIPRVSYSDIQQGRISDRDILEIKKRGCIVITGAVPPEVSYRKTIHFTLV
jgi:hypothetical protein